MISWLQKISAGNESRAEGENDEMSIPNYRYRDWITIHTLPNISRSKSNQRMKFDQSIECNKRKFFFKNNEQNEAERLVPDL